MHGIGISPAGIRSRRRPFAVIVTTVAALTIVAGYAAAITFGQPDLNRHPEVGALLADDDPDSPGPDIVCSGTLISPTVFLTEGGRHCIGYLESLEISQVWVTFASSYDEDSTSLAGLIAGTYENDPRYGQGGLSDPHDLGVILFASPVVGIRPAQLPSKGLLDEIDRPGQTFTAVGYGARREIKQEGPHAFFFDGERRFVLQDFLSLQNSWLLLNQNPSTGSGGSCYDEAGGPHFLGGETSHLLVSISVTGDAMCRAIDMTYRLDTDSAREFLDDYVALP